ncbi:MAG TPA: NUDIX domain-containing protein [Candidatus Methanoperedens sp.]|nr:NUDIX domain-containing protein [Candidatus Methanoperedens sp.]
MTEKFQKVAAHALIINNEGKFLVAHRSLSNDHEPDKFDLFGGTVEIGEHLQEALTREIFEEASIKVEILKLIHGYDFMSGEFRHQFQLTYLCKYLGGEIKYEANDHDSHRWVTLEELDAIPNKIGFLNSLCAEMIKRRVHL